MAATIEAGAPEIVGLGNGDYYLKETKAPDGYNLLKDATKVTINSKNEDATFYGENDEKPTGKETGDYKEGGVEVVNQQGTELPSTGGMGTTIFYTVGGTLMVGALVFFLVKRRMGGPVE